MEQLKPCPFCNGKAHVELVYPGVSPEYSVKCEKCKVWTTWYRKRQDAVKAWNRRAGK